jgi:primosomal protein N'
MARARLIVMNSALGPLDYRVPQGMQVEAGSVVVAPLGPRQLIGVVWEPERLPAEEVGDNRLRNLIHVYDLPPIAAPLRRLVEWTADYYLSPLASVLRMALPSSGRWKWRARSPNIAPPAAPKRLTAASGAGADRRAAGLNRTGDRRRCSDGGPDRGQRDRNVEDPFPDPDPATSRPRSSPPAEAAADRRRRRRRFRALPARRRHRFARPSLRRSPKRSAEGGRPWSCSRNRPDRAFLKRLLPLRLRSRATAFGLRPSRRAGAIARARLGGGQRTLVPLPIEARPDRRRRGT